MDVLTRGHDRSLFGQFQKKMKFRIRKFGLKRNQNELKKPIFWPGILTVIFVMPRNA